MRGTAMRLRRLGGASLAALALAALTACSAVGGADGNAARSATAGGPKPASVYTPPPGVEFPTQVYWGDTHLHTNRSVDANGMGNKLLTPEDAYRFAKGEALTGHNGMKAQLARPLDFIVVADHAVNIGVMPAVQRRDPAIMRTEVGKLWAELHDQYAIKTQEILAAKTLEEYRAGRAQTSSSANPPKPQAFFWRAWSTDYVRDPAFRRSVWEDVCQIADRHNEPGKFTAFIGFEWTPSTASERSPNFHRNIIFEGNSDQACKVLPFSVQDSENVEDLWAYLENYETKVGGKVLAIPHNGNLSSGMMFKLEDYEGNPVDAAYAETRARWEPLYEMTQYKGDSEAHPVTSPEDEFADYETWPVYEYFARRPEGWQDQKQYEYARPALKLGLGAQADLGVNPFKFGMIGSTDAHTSMATADEDNYWGKTSLDEPNPFRAIAAWNYAASGYAGVWAHENTRASIFAAMQRKEVYATTGPRMSLRFFGGWNYAAQDAESADPARVGYQKGVPMGADLTQAPAGRSPSFLIRAVKDPIGANLDRVQVIKGWRSADGKLHERVYDVAVSDGRTIPADGGDVAPVGSTINFETATYENTIGDPELAVVWTDPDFDAKELAFYYVRVIEIPTPRWTLYDKVRFNIKNLPPEVPLTTQERAYSSPIWYTPS